MLTQKKLKELLEYNEKTGVFRWKVYKSSNSQKGDIAGTINKDGYVIIQIDGKRYKAHRLVFLYMIGTFPKEQVDHLNHTKDENRWCNLREVTSSENQRNRSISKNNTSGTIGVRWSKKDKRWIAYIRVNYKKNIYLGSFKNKKEAIKARKEAEIKYGFHKNHGK